METAPPILSEKNLNMNFKVSEAFTLNDIKLTISYNDDIILFKAEEKEENVFPQKEYSVIQRMEDLLNIDKYFRQFDNLKEVFDSLKILINNKTISIIKKENEISLKMKNLNTNKEFFINLKYKEKDLKSEIKDIIPYISSLQKKISNLENQIKDMKNDFDNKLQDIDKRHKDELDLFKKQIKEYIKKNNEKKKKELFNNSNIIQSNENELIYKWFDNKIPFSAKLLLNARIEDNFWKEFFENCGGKKNTMIFIKTTDGERFGGFTSVVWPTNGAVKDTQSFLFSLTKKEKYKINNPDKAILTEGGGWISFGLGHDLFLYNKLKNEGGGTVKKYYDISGENYSLSGGKSRFKLTNCEIYQIEF